MKYSRKQISEAIKYWTRQLKALDESKAKVIDDLIEKFGEDVVLSKTGKFQPNTNNLRQIYDILNFRLFDNMLKNIPVTAEHSKNIADRLNIYNEVSRGDELKLDDVNVYSVHLAAVNETEAVNGKTTRISIFDNIIMLNRDLMVPGVFIFIVSSLCHEMIHYCNSFSDELRAHVLKSCNYPDYKYDSHNDPVFQEKMSQANDNGLHVTKTV